jgi:hypothetical protein
MPQFDNSPDGQENGLGNLFEARNSKGKWDEVMKFMRQNPAIMLDVMPPTPQKAKTKKPAAVGVQAGWAFKARQKLQSNVKLPGLPKNPRD